jgi:hypothetical protein
VRVAFVVGDEGMRLIVPDDGEPAVDGEGFVWRFCGRSRGANRGRLAGHRTDVGVLGDGGLVIRVIWRAAAGSCQAYQPRGRPQADKPPSAHHQPFPPSQLVGLPKRIGPPQQEVHPHQRAHSRQRWKVSPTSFRQLAVMAENLSRRPCSFAPPPFGGFAFSTS